MKPSVRYYLLLGLAAALNAAVCFAQYQVNSQVNTGVYPTYSNSGSMRYSGQNPVNNPMLPSQNRYAVVQSGMTNSEIRGNAMAAGPMAEGGVAAVVPGGTPLSRATGNPASPGPTASQSAPTGSMRYSQSSAPGGSADLRIGGPINYAPVR